MSAEISIDGMGQAELVLADTGAWHSLGMLTEGAFDSETAMKIACPWEAIKSTLYLADGRETSQIAILRSDTRNIIGYAGAGYELVQPKEMFDFTDSWLHETKNHFETAGALRGGSVLFCTARLPDYNLLDSGDIYRTYLVFINSFDGSFAAQAYLTRTRIVCMNTLQMSMYDAKRRSIKFRHTKKVHEKLLQAGKIMEGINATETIINEKLELFTQKKLSKESYIELVDVLFPGDSTRSNNTKKVVTDIFASNDGNAFPDWKGTAYNLFNAITNYVDHEKGVRLTKDTTFRNEQEARFDSAILGSGARLKEQALDIIWQWCISTDSHQLWADFGSVTPVVGK